MGAGRSAPAPSPRETTTGVIEPSQEAFSGFVFKIQANMDPKHRDRVAFVRVVSGRFDAGMQVLHGRTGKMVRLNAPQTFMARERTAEDGVRIFVPPAAVIAAIDIHLSISRSLYAAPFIAPRRRANLLEGRSP